MAMTVSISQHSGTESYNPFIFRRLRGEKHFTSRTLLFADTVRKIRILQPTCRNCGPEEIR
jgi:hypothetical protein